MEPDFSWILLAVGGCCEQNGRPAGVTAGDNPCIPRQVRAFCLPPAPRYLSPVASLTKRQILRPGRILYLSTCNAAMHDPTRMTSLMLTSSMASS